MLSPGALQEIEREQQRRDFSLWLKSVSPTWSWDWAHLQFIRDKLDLVTSGECKRLALFVPPRHGKSEQVTVRYPVWRLESTPTLKIIIGAYNQTLAESFSRKARRVALARFALSTERATAGEWETAAGGGVRAVGVGAGVTGHGGDLIVIDDPVKNREEANSETYREHVWDWYRDDLYTRLEPGGAIVLIMCMTGNTPVLMADGTERALRDIRVGDQVATYDNGRLATSTVRNHISNGADYIYKITTACGKIVHANERHPFLVEEHGELRWLRLKYLTTAHKIVTVKGSGASGKGRSVPLRTAKSPLSVGDTAPHTTARKCGLTDIDLRRLMLSATGNGVSNIGMGSPVRSTMRWWPRKMANVLYAISRQATMYERIGAGSCALTTATRPVQSEGFCATIVTSPWDTLRQRQPHSLLPNTSDFTTEAIASIEPAGIKEVFDIQIERTENFIANGLVSHNTRWHEDDLAGRILNSEKGGDWTVISLPAEAEAGDQLGRGIGEALCPERFDLDALADIKTTMGRSYWALYQQAPQPQSGEFFKREWFTFEEPRANLDGAVRYWDKAASADDGDYTAGVLIGKRGRLYYVMDVIRGQWSTFEREEIILKTAHKDLQRIGPSLRIWVEQEPGSGGKDSAQMTIARLAGFNVRAERPTGDKATRAEPFAAQCEAKFVRLVKATWNDAYLDELCGFPFGKYDDQVDASSGAFNNLVGKGHTVVFNY